MSTTDRTSMRRCRLVVWAAAISMTCLALARPTHARVVLVGVDGASWNLIDRMMHAGQLPHLKRLAERGVTAEMETVEPVKSPVVWTSIATGRSPQAHGITGFYTTRLAIQVPTVFERLAAAGLRVGLYDYLLTWPPVSLPGGFVIPGWLRRDDAVTPPDVWARIRRDPFVHENRGAKTNEGFLRKAHLEITRKPERFVELTRAFALDVGAVVFYAMDMISHRFWHGAYPDEFDEAIRPANDAERNAAEDTMRGIDRAIGQIASSLGPDDVIILVSDHGFKAKEEGVKIIWSPDLAGELARAELVPERDGFSVIGTFGFIVLRVFPGPLIERDRVTQRLVSFLHSYQTEDGRPLFEAVESVDVAQRPAGTERSFFTRLWQWGVEKILRYKFNIKLDPTAHAMVFALPDAEVLEEVWPQGHARVSDRTVAVNEVWVRYLFTGDHDPTAVFLAAGGPIAHMAERNRISALDVAPLVYYLASQPIPDDLEGRLPREFISPKHLSAHPPRAVAASNVRDLPRTQTSAPVSEDPELVDKLRSLGYIE